MSTNSKIDLNPAVLIKAALKQIEEISAAGYSRATIPQLCRLIVEVESLAVLLSGDIIDQMQNVAHVRAPEILYYTGKSEKYIDQRQALVYSQRDVIEAYISGKISFMHVKALREVQFDECREAAINAITKYKLTSTEITSMTRAYVSMVEAGVAPFAAWGEIIDSLQEIISENQRKG
jgi:hypothetical protein